MDTYLDDEIRRTCMNSVQLVLSKCDDFITLENMLTSSTPGELMIYILDKISKVFLFYFLVNYLHIFLLLQISDLKIKCSSIMIKLEGVGYKKALQT